MNNGISSPETRDGTRNSTLHFLNQCYAFPGQFSCAIDCFLELSNKLFLDHLSNAVKNDFFETLFEACMRYRHAQNCSQLTSIRELVWSKVRQHCDTCSRMGIDTAFSDIFTDKTFGMMNEDLQSLFTTRQQSISLCSHCNHNISRTLNIIVCYARPFHVNFQHEASCPVLFSAYLSNILLPHSANLYCHNCKQTSESLQHFQSSVNLPTFLFVELASDIINLVEFPENIEVICSTYKLHAIVRSYNSHFTVLIRDNDTWQFFDDLSLPVVTYTSLQQAMSEKRIGCFFGVYKFVSANSHVNTSCSCNVTITQNQPLNINRKRPKDTPAETATERVSNKRAKESLQQHDQRIAKARKYQEQKTKTQNLPSKINGQYKKNSQTNANQICTDEEFNANMTNFHKNLNYKIQQCRVCHEAWPTNTKLKENYQCSRCNRDKNTIKKFSEQNLMIPSKVPSELTDLTQIEEMLIARAFPQMSVYLKPGGQRAYKGHCITFPQNIYQLASILPRCPKTLPIIVFSSFSNRKNNMSKDFIVRREKVAKALNWLILNNPLYKDVHVDKNVLNDLPTNGIPNLPILNCETNDSELDIDVDRGPVDIDSEEMVYDRNSEMSSFIPSKMTKMKKETDLITDAILKDVHFSWPDRGEQPLNEFTTQYLATMAFPTLFPDGIGDPTNSIIPVQVSFSDKIKHLIRFAECVDNHWVFRFAKHPRFAYWVFDMLQRQRILNQSNIFIKQHPKESHYTVDELKEMLTSNNYGSFISKLTHYAKNITGSNAYWHQAQENLKATIYQVGPPTIFFTLSCADYHWPEFHKLFDLKNPEDITSQKRRENVLNNPHILDWLFTQRVDYFVKWWLYKSLKAVWHWYRYEYAVQRGSIHCHGVAKLESDPGLCDLTEIALKGHLAEKEKKTKAKLLTEEQLLLLENDIIQGDKAKETICQYVDQLLCTTNPCPPENGWTKPTVHPCKVNYLNITKNDLNKDYVDLLNSVQRHTQCSTKYCLRKTKNSDELKCRFNFPFDNCNKTTIEFEKIHTKDNSDKYRAKIVNQRNDPRVNRHHRFQLQGWRANCDLQIVIDYHACLEYLTKYTAKSEKTSEVAKQAFSKVVNNLDHTSDDTSKATKQLMMKSVGERDLSIQEVMHSILSIKFVSSSFEIISVDLNGRRRINFDQDKTFCTSPSFLDDYAQRQQFLDENPSVSDLSLIMFVSQYYVKNQKLMRRKKEVIVRAYPTYSSNPKNPSFGLYCKYQLIRHKPWKITISNAWDNKPETTNSFVTCWNEYLSSDIGKNSVPNWHSKIECVQNYLEQSDNTQSNDNDNTNQIEPEEKEEWMFMADMNYDKLDSCTTLPCNLQTSNHWTETKQLYTSDQIGQMPTWISSKKSEKTQMFSSSPMTYIDIQSFSKMQHLAYSIVKEHFDSKPKNQLLLIIKGLAGSGKSYVIDALQHLLGKCCSILSFTGKAAFNVKGKTLHSVLRLPIGAKRRCELQGVALRKLQEDLSEVTYIIIDEYSLIGQNMLGWIDSRLKQATGLLTKPFGGISIILVGDNAQLPPVCDKPLYYPYPSTEKAIQGYCMYNNFDKVVKLTVNQRAKGDEASQKSFRDIQLRLRNGDSTINDWHILMTRTAENCKLNLETPPSTITKLAYSRSKVAELNQAELNHLQTPIACIKAKHSKGAQHLSVDDMGGLEPMIFLARNAKVMLTANLWQEVGLYNGAMGRVIDIVYGDGHQPPELPVSVIVQFDADYIGPSFLSNIPRSVPIHPITQTSDTLGSEFERQQLPLQLAWAMTIHKSQGLTMDKAWIDLGQSEKVAGLTYVAISRVKHLEDLVIEPIPFSRLQAIKKSKNLHYRIQEEERLDQTALKTEQKFWYLFTKNKF